MKSVVYFVRCADSGLVKIGTTTKMAPRFRAMQAESGGRLRVLGTVAGDKELEAELHARFASGRSHNEWFVPSKALTDYIETHASPWSMPRPKPQRDRRRPITGALWKEVQPRLCRRLKQEMDGDWRRRQQLAAHCRVSVATIRNWIDGKTNPRGEPFVRMLGFFGPDFCNDVLAPVGLRYFWSDSSEAEHYDQELAAIQCLKDCKDRIDDVLEPKRGAA